MSKKHHGGPAPVPPGNQSPAGAEAGRPRHLEAQTDPGTGFQPEDPKRRLGDYTTEGEHARQQPGRANDGDTHRQ